MNICYVGNSVSAQRMSFHDWLTPLLTEFSSNSKIVNCSLGGSGSLGISFFINQFVGDTKIDLCFLETFVADLGKATPKKYISAALRGIICNPKFSNAHIIPIYLYRSDVTGEAYSEILDIYDEVFLSAGITPVNIYQMIEVRISEGHVTAKDIVYDKIHTTPFGAKLYAELIYQTYQELKLKHTKPKRQSASSNNLIMPIALQPIKTYIKQGCFEPGLFRWTMPFIQIPLGYSVEFVTGDFGCIGLIVIADAETGVLNIGTNEWLHKVQNHDAWCINSRIQVVIFPESLKPFSRFLVEASKNATGDAGSNLSLNPTIRVGKNIKIVQLMGFQPINPLRELPCQH